MSTCAPPSICSLYMPECDHNSLVEEVDREQIISKVDPEIFIEKTTFLLGVLTLAADAGAAAAAAAAVEVAFTSLMRVAVPDCLRRVGVSAPHKSTPHSWPDAGGGGGGGRGGGSVVVVWRRVGGGGGVGNVVGMERRK